MKRLIGTLLVSLVASGAAWIGAACTGTARADEPATGSGTWQKHEYSFVSMGFTSTYSCDGLADKLKLLLLAAGARADAKAYPGACPSNFGHPDKLARADLVFYTLMPSPEGAEAAAPAAAGAWHTVVLTRNSPRELGLGDCELVQQFRDQLLPMFATRNLTDQTTCVPHQDSGSVIDLRFDSFTAAVPPKRP